MKYLFFSAVIIFISLSLFADIPSQTHFFPTNHKTANETAKDSALDTPRDIITSYRKIIIKTAKSYHIEPLLLASVVFTETYGGGVSGWYQLKNRLSITKQLITGTATIGITQVNPKNIKDFENVILYNSDIIWQLNQGAKQLASIRDALYPNTPHLSDERAANVLRFYNQGTKAKLSVYSAKEQPTQHYALCHYKKNLRIRKKIRAEKSSPYYSNEISVYRKETESVAVYCFGVQVAEYSIGGNRNKANTYARTAYTNRYRIRHWLGL